MTVTRKDLNMIAATLNQQLVACQEDYMALISCKKTRVSSAKVQQCLAQGKTAWATSENMHLAMRKLNPNVDYGKWRAAILKGLDTTSIASRNFVNVITGKVKSND